MTDLSATFSARYATRLAFFAAGFVISCWAPLIPFVKSNVGANEATFGLLLLCLGLGSIIAMPFTGWISARRGSRGLVIASGIAIAALLPVLVFAQTPATLAISLFVFGAALGTLDVSMNVHATEVEAIEQRPLMSGFHAQYSIGCLIGAALATGLLSFGLTPQAAAFFGSALTCLAILLSAPNLLRARGGDPEPFVFPRGIVLVLAVLTGISFLVEGAILDWGALLLTQTRVAEVETAGIGYILFSLAMVTARLTGDRIVARAGAFRVLLIGGTAAVAGLILASQSMSAGLALTGFALIGLGAANAVPVLFSIAGRQTYMPAGLAIASVSFTGYAGILLGPALVGFAAQRFSLAAAFLGLAVLMAVIPLSARLVTAR